MSIAVGGAPQKPILIISSASNPFTGYYAEILRAEGVNIFEERDISTVSYTLLTYYDVAILGEMVLTTSQVTMLSDWVNAGGSLIAMRPDKKLASLLGLTAQAPTLSNAYLLVDTSGGPGVGIVDQSIQFHGTADLYTLSGATSLATLYSNANTATANPAVTLKNVGANGGQAAAFTYDLARSVVYTRQGNPAWAGQERDGISVIRSDDLFYGDASFDPQPDWIDLNKVAIPQADEQQRLLANLMIQMNFGKKPLPRFWYLPRNLEAAVVMTGDDHGVGNRTIVERFDSYMSISPPGCSVENWECIRGTSYVYTGTDLTDAEASAYNSAGFEVALHVDTNCTEWTPSSLESFYVDQIDTWSSKYQSLPLPVTNRTHCIAWSDYATQPIVEAAHGIGFDTNYYYYPSSWMADRPGFFTGSGMPMRFADSNGILIDVYQATTQMTDESGQTYPYTIDTLLDKAIGPEGYYGVFTVNAHTDSPASSVSDAIVQSAMDRGIPVISARQMLEWLDGRNASTFDSLFWNGSTLSFSINVAQGANGLVAMVPVEQGKTVSRVLNNGNAVPFTMKTVKGVLYARFYAANGAFQVEFTEAVSTGPEPFGWYAGDMHVHRSCGGPPDSISSMKAKMSNHNLAVMTLLADMGNGEVQDPVQDLPRVNGQDDPISTPGQLLHWDAEWHWDPVYNQYPHQALGGHVVALGLTEAHQIWEEYTYPIFNWARQQNGIAGFVHMQYLDDGIPQSLNCCIPIEYPVEVALGSADFISEDVNGSESAILAYYRLLNTGFRPGLAAGTDNPCGNTDPGSLLTYVQVEGGQLTYRNWIEGIAAGRTVISRNGHNEFLNLTVNNTAVPGDEIRLAGGGSVPVTIEWTATQNLSGTIELVSNGVVLASKQASVAPGASASLSGTVDFTKSGWLAARRMGGNGHEVHTGAVFIIVENKPIRVSSADAEFYVQWMDNLLAKTSPGGAWSSYFVNSRNAAQTRYQAAKSVYQQIALEANEPSTGSGPSIWPGTTVPGTVDSGPDSAVELGVKFRSDTAGYITGIRFYKASTNTGTHVGNLWTSTGTRLATATFANETASGWQQVNFATPVAITANTVYVASYHTNSGHYSGDLYYFTSKGMDSPPLHALADGVSGVNGVYAYGSGSSFPSNGWNSSNYWVDVVFQP